MLSRPFRGFSRLYPSQERKMHRLPSRRRRSTSSHAGSASCLSSSVRLQRWKKPSVSGRRARLVRTATTARRPLWGTVVVRGFYTSLGSAIRNRDLRKCPNHLDYLLLLNSFGHHTGHCIMTFWYPDLSSKRETGKFWTVWTLVA